MTTSSETASRVNANSDDLRPALAAADSGVLLAILVQLTGDTELLARLAPQITHTPDAPEFRGEAPEGVHAEIIDRLLEAIDARELRGLVRGEVLAPVAWETEIARSIFELALGQPVADDYVPMLFEQGGFRDPQPELPRTHPIPTGTKVAIIGAGLAGIAAALAARRAGVDFEIFERNADIGGTWLIQTYPGVAVDTPSAYYSLSTDLNAEWTSYYPKGGEYENYLRRVVAEHDLAKHIVFNTEVEAMHWDDESAQWRIHLLTEGNREVRTANAVIPAAGYLNRPKYPDWPGRESFAGLSVHSGEWPQNLDLTGKRIAVVGTGCTAVQIVDALVDQVAELTVVQRQPHWVAPRKRLSDEVPAHDRLLLRELPLYAQWRRLKSFWGASDNGYPVVKIDREWMRDHVSISRANDFLMQDCLTYIDRMFGAGTELAAKVTPNYPPFGKRIIRDPGGYYRALAQPHVRVETDPIQRVEPTGLVTANGELIELDVIVYATGFTLDYLSTIDIRGRGGVSLNDAWAGNPRAYRGGMVPGFPNFFMTSGPNQNPSHGAGNNFGIEVIAHYAFECLQMLAERGAKAIEATPEAYDAYVERIDRDMEDTVWRHTDHVNTYYRNHEGRVIVACPWRLVDVWHEHRRPVAEHFAFDATAQGA